MCNEKKYPRNILTSSAHNVAFSYYFLRDSVHSHWLCQGPGCRPEGPRQVCAPWAWDTKDLHALVQPTPAGSSYRETEDPPSCEKSGRSSGLERERDRKRDRWKDCENWSLTYQFLDWLVGTGLNRLVIPVGIRVGWL